MLENVARLAGAYVGSADDAEPPSDLEVERLVRALITIGYAARDAFVRGTTPDAALRLELARVSERTHGADLAAGREMFADKSWPLSHELAVALGLRKVQALASILVPLWQRIEAGEARYGSAPRLRRLWSRTAQLARPALSSRPSAGLAQLMADWGVDADAVRGAVAPTLGCPCEEAGRLADGTWQAWGLRLPMLRGLGVDEVRALYADCLAPGHPEHAPIPGPRPGHELPTPSGDRVTATAGGR